MGLGAKHQKQTQNYNQTTQVNQPTQQQLQQIYGAAQAAGQAGPSPLLTGAAGYNAGAQGAGANGLAALGGNAQAVQTLMDPYLQQVIGGMNKQFAVQDAQTANQVRDEATRSGAFGGSREAVLQANMQSQNQLNQNQQVAQLLSGGYQNAMQNAGQAAFYGMQGSNANANLGMNGVGNPYQWYFNMLRQGFIMPQGSTSTGGGASSNTEAGANFKIPFFG